MTAPGHPRRLRVVVARYGDQVVGGAETLARLLVTELARRGWAVQVLTSCAVDEATWADALPPGPEPGTTPGVRVLRFPVPRPRRPRLFRELSRGFWRLPARLRPEARYLAMAGPVMPGLMTALDVEPEEPTLFISYLYHPFVEGVRHVTGPRILLPTAHDEPPLTLRAVGRALAAVDGLWYATAEERAIVERVHPATVGRPAAVGNVGIEPPTGVDGGRFRARSGVTGPYLLYGGRDTPGKGVDQLLEGFELLRSSQPGVSLVLTGQAGSGGVPGSPPGVVRAGMLDDADHWDAIAGASAVVVPSFHESLSLLALEAWAMGRPVLLNGASPVLGGQAERSGGGAVYRGADGLAAAAARLLGDPSGAADLGACGRAYVERVYRWDAVVGHLERLLDGAAGSR